MEFPNNPKPFEDEMVNTYVKTLAQVVESEEETKKKIYSVSTVTYTSFGALISEELSYKVKELPIVLWALPDSYLDVPNKDYGVIDSPNGFVHEWWSIFYEVYTSSQGKAQETGP